MDRTSYTNLAKSWEYVEDHAFSRQSAELNAIRTAAEEAGIPQGSAAQAELLRMLVRMLDASSVIAIGTGSVVETMQLINGLDNAGQLTAVDSSTQGIALIRKLFNRLSDDTETTLRAVNASAGVFLPRLNAENYDLIVVAGDPENYAAAFAQAPRLLKPHAAIVFTDVLAFDSATSAGGVLNPANRDAKSIAMRELLETVEEVISFYRTYGEERWLVVTNFSDKVQPFSADVSVEQVMIENMPTDVTALADYSLAPWQAFVVKVSQ